MNNKTIKMVAMFNKSIKTPCVVCGTECDEKTQTSGQTNGFKMHSTCRKNLLNGVAKMPTYDAGKIGNDPSVHMEFIVKDVYEYRGDVLFDSVGYVAKQFGYPMKRFSPSHFVAYCDMNSLNPTKHFCNGISVYGTCKCEVTCKDFKITLSTKDPNEFVARVKAIRKLVNMNPNGKPYKDKLEYIKELEV